jgi:protocatechuate 3,4-dioxygenase beta subunit
MKRREFLVMVSGGAVAALAACRRQQTAPAERAAEPSPAGAASSPTPAEALAPTPSCEPPEQATVAQTEGPYFTPNSPERASLLEGGVDGDRLVLTGKVMHTDCRPVARALLDFWQANNEGQYDNRGYRLRGHQFTDTSGAYRLETIIPGQYPGRTRHIHVKVQASGGPILTTQLYFPGEAQNRRDGIFDERLTIAMRTSAGGGKEGSFDFVLRA